MVTVTIYWCTSWVTVTCCLCTSNGDSCVLLENRRDNNLQYRWTSQGDDSMLLVTIMWNVYHSNMSRGGNFQIANIVVSLVK